MPLKLTVLFLIFWDHSISQLATLPTATQFDKFITNDKIQWAAYANETITFDKYNLSEELYKRFQAGKIKISEPLLRDSLMAGKKINYLNKKELELRSFAPGSDLNSKPTNRVDSNSSALIHAEQILYVANGKLYSYVPWVSPLISVYTSSDRFIGTTEYFSSSINRKYNFKSSKRDDLTFITTTKTKISLDSLPRTNMLKQLYGINMLEAIWDDLTNDKNEITNLSNQQKVALKDLKDFTYSGTVSIPIYNAEGKITGYQEYSEPISPSLFQQIEITQSWYYNYSRNIVVNNITDITLYLKNKGFSENEQSNPVLKITFK